MNSLLGVLCVCAYTCVYLTKIKQRQLLGVQRNNQIVAVSGADGH